MLIADDEPGPVMWHRREAPSPFLLACDHAALRIPRALGSLGIGGEELRRHIGWDIGIWGVSMRLADALDAALVGQVYSRLVIDCNRMPGVPSSIPLVSEATTIPGNEGLSDADRAARVAEVFDPYQQAIAGVLAERTQTIFVAMHSFTPSYLGVARPWHAGVLFNRDARLARPLLDLLRAEPGLVVGENEPYAVSDLTDYTVPVHCERRGLVHVELEIRQDLIADAAGEREWAERLARLLPQAVAKMEDRA